MQMQDPRLRCLAMVERLNQEFQWGLESADHLRYAHAVLPCLPSTCSEGQVRTIVMNYHLDHTLVESLRDRGHQHYQQAWADWMHQALPVLRRAGLSWSSDVSIDSDDLAQIARFEVFRSIDSFRYQSRFSTWAHRVIVYGIQRHIRDSLAQKRAVRPGSLDQVTTPEVPITLVDQPEEIVSARLLMEQIAAILNEQADPRLHNFFQLWAVQDIRVADIGTMVQLHPSRIRALLQHIRQILREHPDIQAWRDAADVLPCEQAKMFGCDRLEHEQM